MLPKLNISVDGFDLVPSMRPWASLVAQRLKRLPAMRETWVQSLGREDPLEKEMATHSSILAWRIPWREEPGGLQSIGSQSWTLTHFTHKTLIQLNTLFYCTLICLQWCFLEDIMVEFTCLCPKLWFFLSIDTLLKCSGLLYAFHKYSENWDIQDSSPLEFQDILTSSLIRI